MYLYGSLLFSVPQEPPVKIVNNNDNKDSSVNGFVINVDGRELYKELLESKNEIIQLLKEENERLCNQLFNV